MKYLIILLILVGFSGSVFAQNFGDAQDDIWMPACPKESKAECDKSSLFPDAISKPFAQSDLVAIGTIVQKENQEQNSITYSINVDFYLKNYQDFDLITAILNNATDPKSPLDLHYYNSPIFNEGDLVFVYLEKSDGNYNLLPQSFALDKHEARGPPPIILLTHTPNDDNFEQGDEILVSGEVRKMELVKGVKDGKKIGVKLTIRDDNKQTIFSKLIDIGIDGNYSYSLDTSKTPPGKYELEINYDSMTYSPEITINFNSKYWTPLKQFKSGIPIDKIQCNNDLHVLTKRPNEKIACVYPLTAEKLDWKIINAVSTMTPSIFEVPKDGRIFDVEYDIKGGVVKNMVFDNKANSLFVTIDSTDKGSLILGIPRGLVDAKFDYCPPKKANPPDDVFFVLLDGEEIPYDEIQTTTEKRTLQIQFAKNAVKIEIIGTCLI